jgi:HEAT repeat protein
MTSEQLDVTPSSTTTEPRFFPDLLSVLLYLIVTIILWAIFFRFFDSVLSLGIFGLAIIFIAMFILMPYTIALFSRLFEVIAYQNASWRTGVPYMNYKTKCPFLKRKLLSFSCRAEQLAPFEVAAFEKCHKKHMWEPCWPERLPSILEVFNDVHRYLPNFHKRLGIFERLAYRGMSEEQKQAKYKQQLVLNVATMKEHALSAATTMYEVLVNETEALEIRITAGFALAEMKEESGITPLISMLGQFDQRSDQTIKAVIARYRDKALPHLIEAVKDCETDMKCGGLIELLGKIGHEDSVPTLEGFLTSDSSGEYTRLQTLYALQEINSEESFKILITYLENAPDEEHEIIKQACLSRKMTSFPLLIELLADREISEDYYSLIGDILAEVDAKTYDRFFTKFSEVKNQETVQRLAKILKENTPEEEEFQMLHQVLSKHSEEFNSSF